MLKSDQIGIEINSELVLVLLTLVLKSDQIGIEMDYKEFKVDRWLGLNQTKLGLKSLRV